MTRKPSNDEWATATWEGARRAQLRATRRMTVRERLQSMQDLNELALRLAKMPRVKRPTADQAANGDAQSARDLP
jgi:hypothetical protein